MRACSEREKVKLYQKGDSLKALMLNNIALGIPKDELKKH